jgi:hypothetical protein
MLAMNTYTQETVYIVLAAGEEEVKVESIEVSEYTC